MEQNHEIIFRKMLSFIRYTILTAVSKYRNILSLDVSFSLAVTIMSSNNNTLEYIYYVSSASSVERRSQVRDSVGDPFPHVVFLLSCVVSSVFK